MRNLIIVLILITYSISYSQKVWEEEGWALTARNLNHEGVKNKSKSDLSKLFEQYLNKASNLKELDELKNDYHQNPVVWFKHVLLLFKNLININKVKEFEEIGIDLNNLGFDSIKSRSAFSQIIFTGVVIDDIATDSEKFRYFKVKIQEVLKGKYFINDKCDYFNMHYSVSDDERDMYYYVNYLPKRKPIEKNRPYIFFINNIDFVSAKYNNNKSDDKENIAPLGDNRSLYYLIDPHQSPDSVKFNELIKEYSYKEFPPYGLTIYREIIYGNEIDSLKNFLESYEKINDTENFYNRSYK